MAKGFWNTLKKNVPAIRQVCSSKAPARVTQKYRTEDGGHLLFRPLGLRCFSAATRVLLDRGASIKQAVARLAKVHLQLHKEPWVNVLWNPHTKRMGETKVAKLAVNLFLNMVGEKPSPTDFNILKEYRKATGQSDARLP